MIPTSRPFDQSTMATLLELDPVVQDSRTFFALLDWSVVDRWEAARSTPGRPSHPETASLKAFLLRIREGFQSTTQLRSFLLKHPLLAMELGFRLVLDFRHPDGFDVEQTFPTRFWFGEKLRRLDRTLFTDLLAATVSDLQAEIPGLGEVVSFDVKHLDAWVKQNNERASVPERYDKTQRLAGDPDCKLGVKRSTTKELDDGSTEEKKELLWGSGSGVAAATTPEYGAVVLAEYTQPFNEGDVTYFRPLYLQAVLALGRFPIHLAADAASDAWSVYDTAARHGGSAAVPLNAHPKTIFDPDGVPRCQQGLRRVPRFFFQHANGSRAQRFGCPLVFPNPTGEPCPKLSSNHGQACHKDPNGEPGGRLRVMLDRASPLYKAIDTQRTSCERMNSKAKELGIERPSVHNGHSVANLNTLVSLVLNVRVLEKARSINAGLLSTPKGVRSMDYLHPSQAGSGPFQLGGVVEDGTIILSVSILQAGSGPFQPAGRRDCCNPVECFNPASRFRAISTTSKDLERLQDYHVSILQAGSGPFQPERDQLHVPPDHLEFQSCKQVQGHFNWGWGAPTI